MSKKRAPRARVQRIAAVLASATVARVIAGARVSVRRRIELLAVLREVPSDGVVRPDSFAGTEIERDNGCSLGDRVRHDLARRFVGACADSEGPILAPGLPAHALDHSGRIAAVVNGGRLHRAVTALVWTCRPSQNDGTRKVASSAGVEGARCAVRGARRARRRCCPCRSGRGVERAAASSRSEDEHADEEDRPHKLLTLASTMRFPPDVHARRFPEHAPGGGRTRSAVWRHPVTRVDASIWRTSASLRARFGPRRHATIS
jgi:hypothetical protein